MTHPFDPLTVEETELAVKHILAANKGSTVHFKCVQNHEPPKAYMTKFLDAEAEGKPIDPPPRIAHSYYVLMEQHKAEEILIQLSTGEVISRNSIKGFLPGDPTEAEEVLPLVYSDPKVHEALRKCGIAEELWKYICAEVWIYGSDSTDEVPPYVNFHMYLRDPKTLAETSNAFAFPIPFLPVVDLRTKTIERIDWCATGGDEDDEEKFNYNTRESGKSILDNLKSAEYDLDLRKDLEVMSLKPYNVLQPEGPSFAVDGTHVDWQKWSFRVGITAREGLVLHDVRFDGRLCFYRLSVSELTVPYGDPRPPLHRKQAFDLGDIGAMAVINSLGLGCDCLGSIKYFDGVYVTGDGKVSTKKNIICMHEKDDGLLYKHSNIRVNYTRIARRRVLVLQMILTLANYDYIIAWHFDQAAGIELEIRATGQVSTQYIDPGKKSKWGNVVAPSVLAASHQHIFSVRIDPAVDGHKNSAQICETFSPEKGDSNPFGTAFCTQTTTIDKSCYVDGDVAKNRFIKIVNENSVNPVSMTPVGWKLFAAPSAMIAAQKGSVASNRALYATHPFWITKYKDQEFFAGGTWTNQSPLEKGGVNDAVQRHDNVRDEDIVLWHSFGLNHMNPRVEDWPIMPVEILRVGLHPNNFFTENPSIDQPQSVQAVNKSVEVNGCCSTNGSLNGASNGSNGTAH